MVRRSAAEEPGTGLGSGGLGWALVGSVGLRPPDLVRSGVELTHVSSDVGQRPEVLTEEPGQEPWLWMVSPDRSSLHLHHPLPQGQGVNESVRWSRDHVTAWSRWTGLLCSKVLSQNQVSVSRQTSSDWFNHPLETVEDRVSQHHICHRGLVWSADGEEPDTTTALCSNWSLL